MADPPRPGVALPALAAGDPLSESEAADLYAAMLRDVCVEIVRSGGELLVNYRPDDQVDGDGDPESELRDAIAPAFGSVDDVRHEVQVGSTFSGRAGNTVTHLLETEGVRTAAVMKPTSAFVERRHVDSAAMKLRQSDVVLGPTTDGRVYYAGFREPIDFDGAFETPEIETLTERAREKGLSVDFIETLPVIERPADLATALPVLRSAVAAEQHVPEHTAEAVAEIGLTTAADGDRVAVQRD